MKMTFSVLKTGKISFFCPINPKVFTSKGRKSNIGLFFYALELRFSVLKMRSKLNKGLSNENDCCN